MKEIYQILKTAKHLSDKELKYVSNALLDMLSKSNEVYGTSVKKIEKCRKCNAEQIVKFGKDKNGKQRYKCKSCGATFIETSFSAISHTRHSDAVWSDYIYLLLKGASLEECAYRCRISVRTAFIWRHKILNALQKDQADRMMGGIVEADEMFLPVSYKGNHSKSKRFTMPREAFKRGTDNRSNRVAKACIMCAVERNGQSYSEVLGAGQPTVKMIDHAFGKRIIPDSIMLADGALAMKNYFAKKTDVALIRLQSTTSGSHHGGDPEIRGIYHIQSANNYHKRLNDFLRRYNGVSTKYLNHYVSLFAWIENHKSLDITLEESVQTFITEQSQYVTPESLFDMPAIPQVA